MGCRRLSRLQDLLCRRISPLGGFFPSACRQEIVAIILFRDPVFCGIGCQQSQSGKEAPGLYFCSVGRNNGRNKEEHGRSWAQLWQDFTCILCVAVAACACKDSLLGRHDSAPFLWKYDSIFQSKEKNFFLWVLSFVRCCYQCQMKTSPSCHCGMKWRRKCGDKRKNCFDLEAFFNDSPFGFRLEWFSSFTALYVSRYRETTSHSPSAWDAIISQDNIADMPLAFMIIKEMVEKKLSYSYGMNISISQLFQRQIQCNHLWGWIFRFCCHSALFLSVTWDVLSLEKSEEF